MKSTGLRPHSLLLAFVLALGGAAMAQTASAAGDDRQGTFKTVQGDVTVARGAVRLAAGVGDGLHTADRILTGSHSSAAVTLSDGTVVSVGPNSAVDLTRFSYNSTTQDGNVLVNLARGTLRMVTGLIAKIHPEQVKVTTPTVVVGVRGTDFIVEEAQQ